MRNANKICQNNTQITLDNGKQCVYLHKTKVVEHNPQGRNVTFNNGGYATMTTKARMNQAMKEWGLPIHIFQEHGVWFAENTQLNVRRSFAGGVCMIGY